MDFLLKNESIVIEAKMTRKGLASKEGVAYMGRPTPQSLSPRHTDRKTQNYGTRATAI